MAFSLLSAGMARTRTGPPPEELIQLRAVIATNLRAHMNITCRGMSETAAAAAVGKASGVGKNTVLRALRKGGDEKDLRLETLVRLANYFGISAQELLIDPRISPGRAQGRVVPGHRKIQETARDQRMDAEVDRAVLRRARRA
jgi:hypothetical protein